MTQSAASPTSFANPRDRHLFGPGPKRILALDGGGVRGVITLAFLERMETLIEEIEGTPVLLPRSCTSSTACSCRARCSAHIGGSPGCARDSTRAT
jgi:hypothetical protein